MTMCNYCLLKRMKLQAAMNKEQVTLLPHGVGFDVYIHPPSVRIHKRNEGEGYWQAWMMGIPKECSC